MRNAWAALKRVWTQNKGVILVIALILLADRATKVLTLTYLTAGAWEPFSWFHLRYVENTGMAFGMLQNGNLLLIFVMIAVVAYLLKSWKELCAMGPLVKWALAFILAGAIGNLYDRITLGFVVDFLDFRVWPVFNVADSFITIGGCLLALSLLLPKGNRKGEEK